MIKKAMTIFEMTVAMMLMSVITVMCINVLRRNTAQNNDIVKFRHIYGAVSEAVYELKNDIVMYPDESAGFSDTSEQSYPNETKKYSNETKFKKLFKSKFNIYKDNIKIKIKEYGLPAYTTKKINADETEHTETKYIKELNCFLDNKGITYCPPETSKNDLADIYIPVYINKIDTSKEDTTDETKIIFIKISKIGKIDMPVYISTNTGEKIIDCTDKKQNMLYHCQAIEKMKDMDF